jgi:hypothetical protein
MTKLARHAVLMRSSSVCASSPHADAVPVRRAADD